MILVCWNNRISIDFLIPSFIPETFQFGTGSVEISLIYYLLGNHVDNHSSGIHMGLLYLLHLAIVFVLT